MCTAINFKSKTHSFGRTLDWTSSYGEGIVITPKNYNITLKCEKEIISHYAIMGMGITEDNYPMYFDGVNENGLCIAGLNFPYNAVYGEKQDKKYNIAPCEMPLWVLSQCKTVDEAKALLLDTNLANIPFSENIPVAPMHWIISDREKSIVAEPLKEGLMIYDNPAEVLTNNPPFLMQYQGLNNYMSLSPYQPKNTFSDAIDLKCFSNGMGAIGLPGDSSSPSRFVRAAYNLHNCTAPETAEEAVNQFFHVLASVEVVKGTVMAESGAHYSIYSSCIDADNLTYYYKTYENHNICKTELSDYDINGHDLIEIK